MGPNKIHKGGARPGRRAWKEDLGDDLVFLQRGAPIVDIEFSHGFFSFTIRSFNRQLSTQC